MKLQLHTKLEHEIADLLWAAKDFDQVNHIVNQYGAPGRKVRDLMLAESLDDVEETELAEQVLTQFRL